MTQARYGEALRGATSALEYPVFPWTTNGVGKVLVGFLLACGFCQAFVQLVSAGLRAAGASPADMPGMVAFFVLGLLGSCATAIGGGVSGAGRRRAALAGLAVGFLAGLTALATSWIVDYPGSGLPTSKLALRSLTGILFGLLLISGTVGAGVGASVWRWSPGFRTGSLIAASTGKIAFGGGFDPSLWSGPVRWVRVLAGVCLAVGAGVVGSGAVLKFLLAASDGTLHIETAFQQRVATVELFALAMIFGAALAGATSRSGLKQGFAVGVGAAAAIVGLAGTGSFPHVGSLEPFAFAAVFLGPLGGWFGAELLPAVPPGRVQRRTAAWWR